MTGAKALAVRSQINDTHVHRAQASYASLTAIRNEIPWLLPSMYSVKLGTMGGSSVANQSIAAIHSRVTCMNTDEGKGPPRPAKAVEASEISNPPHSWAPTGSRPALRPLGCPILRSSSLVHIISFTHEPQLCIDAGRSRFDRQPSHGNFRWSTGAQRLTVHC